MGCAPRACRWTSAKLWHHLSSGIMLSWTATDGLAAPLPHYTQTEIEHIVAQPVLEQLGLLHVTRRRITPVF